MDSKSQWRNMSADSSDIAIMDAGKIGGWFDLMDNGALLLPKIDKSVSFHKSDAFVSQGVWQSKWMIPSAEAQDIAVELQWKAYGKKQDMRNGWTKFSGNPLVCSYNWKNASEESLQLPEEYSGEPNDQALLRGHGEFEGKWILLFNIGPWAVKGWGMAVADSLEPIKRGENPFRIIPKYYPLNKGTVKNDTVGYNAPNDWIFMDGVYYSPDESRDHSSKMWTSTDLLHWTNQDTIHGINGHDPGMCFDGAFFYLFNEDDKTITYCKTKDPLGKWTPMGAAVEIGNHTGDADVSFFNNRWHMFYDDAPHAHYQIGYATTTPEKFPVGWKKEQKIIGPYHPDSGQIWDNDDEQGNQFGTGDGDMALENNTIYLTYERPVGVAFKELDVMPDATHSVRMKIEFDENQDGTKDNATNWEEIHDMDFTQQIKAQGAFRIILELRTEDSTESPLIESIKIKEI